MRNKLRRSLATAVALTGIWALDTTGASAAQPSAATGTSTSADDVSGDGTADSSAGTADAPKQDRSPGVGLPPAPGTGTPGAPGRPMWSGPGAHTLPVHDGRRTMHGTEHADATEHTGAAGYAGATDYTGPAGYVGAARQASAARQLGAARQPDAGAQQTAQQHTTARGAAARDAGEAISDVTQKAGAAVSQVRPAAAHQDVGAVSGLAAPAAAPSAPGVPEDLMIGVPEVVPGVPSVGVVPLSVPALPVTPGVPSL